MKKAIYLKINYTNEKKESKYSWNITYGGWFESYASLLDKAYESIKKKISSDAINIEIKEIKKI